MADERVLTTVLHVEGGGDVVDHISISAPTSLNDLAGQLGVTFTTKYRREPWTQAELWRGDLEATVAELREEFPDGDYPLAQHGVDEPCTSYEALRFLER